ncbi:MAG TPA: hypothetical protein PKY81_09140 [bacterium]|nr:hypothetical protein [bacterium]
MYYQQGDILVKKIEKIPSDCKKSLNSIIAEGEATGHKHIITGNAEIYKRETQNNLGIKDLEIYIIVNDGTTILQHNEHKSIFIEPGSYKIDKVREYDHFDNRNNIRTVED